MLRLLGRTEEPVSVAIWHNIVGAITYPLIAIFIGLGQNNNVAGIYPLTLVVFGIGATFVQIGFTSAYRYGEAVVLVPIRYLSVPLASALGWIIWEEKLNFIEISGMVLVITACVVIAVREYILGRKQAA